MRYIHNDFFSNFSNFIRANDAPMMEDIVMNELAYIIAYQRDSLIDTMRASGIEVKDDISDKKLIDIIAENAGNKKFRFGLGIMITKNNKKSLKNMMNRFSNAEGEGKEKFKAFWSKLWGTKESRQERREGGANGGGGAKDPISAVANAIGNVFGFLKSGQDKEIIQDSNKTDLYKMVMQNKMNQATAKARSKATTLWIVGGIAAATVITFGIIALRTIRK